jgi:hypothetical protein
VSAHGVPRPKRRDVRVERALVDLEQLLDLVDDGLLDARAGERLEDVDDGVDLEGELPAREPEQLLCLVDDDALDAGRLQQGRDALRGVEVERAPE